MEQLLKISKNIFLSATIVVLGIALVFPSDAVIYAQEVDPGPLPVDDGSPSGDPAVPDSTQNSGDFDILDTPQFGSGETQITPPPQQTSAQPTQAQSAVTGQANTGTNATPDLTTAAMGATNCALGGVVSGVVTGLLNSWTNPDRAMFVPTVTVDSDRRSGGSFGWPPSADSIAYCIINTMIEYLANATIEWINSGFDGNPAFVQDPQRFFSDVAKNEAGGLIQEIVYNTTGLNVCEPFRIQIATGIANDFVNPGRGSQCSIDSIASNAAGFDAYLSGNSPGSGNLNNWITMTQNPQNNIYGADFLARQEVLHRIALQQNTLKVDLSQGNGFLSFKKCNPDSTTTNDKGQTIQVKGACAVTTPGHVIEDQLNSKLKMGDNRLLMADKFDQMVSALVNTLIKTALNQVLNNTGTQ